MSVLIWARGGFTYAECQCGWSMQSHGTDESSRGFTKAKADEHELTHVGAAA